MFCDVVRLRYVEAVVGTVRCLCCLFYVFDSIIFSMYCICGEVLVVGMFGGYIGMGVSGVRCGVAESKQCGHEKQIMQSLLDAMLGVWVIGCALLDRWC